MTVVADTMNLPFISSTPHIARTKLASFLTINRIDMGVIDNALIVLSEMIANAVSHGVPDEDGMMEVAWCIRDASLELVVTDAGDCDVLIPVPFDEDSLSGRGLSIISQLSENWSVEVTDGTRIRAQLALA